MINKRIIKCQNNKVKNLVEAERWFRKAIELRINMIMKYQQGRQSDNNVIILKKNSSCGASRKNGDADSRA